MARLVCAMGNHTVHERAAISGSRIYDRRRHINMIIMPGPGRSNHLLERIGTPNRGEIQADLEYTVTAGICGE